MNRYKEQTNRQTDETNTTTCHPEIKGFWGSHGLTYVEDTTTKLSTLKKWGNFTRLKVYICWRSL